VGSRRDTGIAAAPRGEQVYWIEYDSIIRRTGNPIEPPKLSIRLDVCRCVVEYSTPFLEPSQKSLGGLSRRGQSGKESRSIAAIPNWSM
jgi:hypothetical protein